jgi:hypothetical protein
MRTRALIRSGIKPAAGSKGLTSHRHRMPCSGRACRSGNELVDGSLGTIFFVDFPSLLTCRCATCRETHRTRPVNPREPFRRTSPRLRTHQRHRTATLFGAIRRLLEDRWIEPFDLAETSRDKQSYGLTTESSQLRSEVSRLEGQKRSRGGCEDKRVSFPASSLPRRIEPSVPRLDCASAARSGACPGTPRQSPRDVAPALPGRSSNVVMFQQ